ncbi:MAG: AIPR family protein [Egibacteraceae bacterium]
MSVFEALEGREDLAEYGDNAIALLGLELRFGVDDLRTVADESLTDDTKDRKCDLLFVDRESDMAVVAQAYTADDPDKPEPPSNKAADLNTALTWILDGEVPDEQLGDKLRSAAMDLRQALVDGEISVLEVWFVHNLTESANVTLELRQVEQTAKALLGHHFRDQADQVEVRALQVSRDRLEAWYRSTSTAILVTDEFVVPAKSGWFNESGAGWSAICTSVSAAWLHELHAKYSDELFSANVRGPIPSRRSRSNINFSIGETAKEHPQRFWAYNNGITALVNHFEADGDGEFKISGIAIVNGAQTTGALARVPIGELAQVDVLARFVKSTDPQIIDDIIRFNNSQNPIKPSDFRSRDPHQGRLRAEFTMLPDVTYLGARRGGQSDVAKKPSNYISSDTAAQALAALHLDPVTAYHDLRLIWERDDKYATYFGDHTSATHIVFCFALLRAVQDLKASLVAHEGDLTGNQEDALSFLRKRGATFLLVAAIGSTLDTILDRAIASPYRLSFGPTLSPSTAVERWAPIVTSLGAFAGVLDVDDSGTAIRRYENLTARITAFQRAVAAVKVPLQPTFKEFAMHVCEDDPPAAPV